MKLFVTISALALLLCYAECAKLPSSFQLCKRNDPNLNECFSKAVEKAFSIMKDPIAELGLPSVEPLLIDSVTINSAGNGNIKINQKLKNVKVHNAVQTKVDKSDLKFDDKTFSLVVHSHVPLTKIESEYEISGQVLVLPISGSGKSEIDLKNPKTVMTLSGSIFDKKGKKHLKLEKVTADVTPEQVTYHFDNLFNGDERLGTEMNKVLNENWKDVFDDIKTAYEEIQANLFKKTAEQIFNKVSFDDLFPL